jgi:hypothetical protein
VRLEFGANLGGGSILNFFRVRVERAGKLVRLAFRASSIIGLLDASLLPP